MLIKLKPNTPGQRGTVLVSKKHLSKASPYKTLTKFYRLQEVEIIKVKLHQEELAEELKENTVLLTLNVISLM